MGELRVRLKTRALIQIKKRNAKLIAALFPILEANPSMVKKSTSVDEVVSNYLFRLEDHDVIGDNEPFREGSIFYNKTSPVLAEKVLSEIVHWIETEEKVDLSDASNSEFKTNLFTQINYNGRIQDEDLKLKLGTLKLFNRFEYLDLDGQTRRYLKK